MARGKIKTAQEIRNEAEAKIVAKELRDSFKAFLDNPTQSNQDAVVMAMNTYSTLKGDVATIQAIAS